jgi:Spy/CpxP family protein refolding chaperone
MILQVALPGGLWALLSATAGAQTAPPATPGEWQQYRSRMVEQLNLSPEQKQRIEAIRNRYEPQFRSLRQQMRNEIRSVLTPAQEQKLEQLRPVRNR